MRAQHPRGQCREGYGGIMDQKATLIHQAEQYEREALAEELGRIHYLAAADAPDPAAVARSRAAENDLRHKARQCWDEVQAIADAEDTREWPPEEPQWLTGVY